MIMQSNHSVIHAKMPRLKVKINVTKAPRIKPAKPARTPYSLQRMSKKLIISVRYFFIKNSEHIRFKSINNKNNISSGLANTSQR